MNGVSSLKQTLEQVAQAILNACHQAREVDSTMAGQPAFTILPCTSAAGAHPGEVLLRWRGVIQPVT